MRAEEVIIEALREGPKTAKQLRRECVKKKGIAGSTYNRQLKKLIKRGLIEEARYEWVGDKEADPDEVAEHIQKLKETEHEELLRAKSQYLMRLCDGKRVAHLPDVLSFFESALENPKFRDPQVLSNLVGAFRRVLYFERKRIKPEKRIIERINRSISRLDKISKVQHEPQVLTEIVYFLGETESKRAVDIIFRLARELPEEEYARTYGISRSLFSPECTLYTKHRKLIDDKLDDMIISPNPSINERGKELANEKQNRRAYANSLQ